MTDHEIHALSGAYAVDALDDEERARFAEHLAACPSCQREVAELREAAARLPQPVAPPAALRDRVLAEIGTVRPLPPPTPETRTRPRRWTRALAAAATVAALAGGGAVLWDQTRTSSTQSPEDRVIQARDAAAVSVDLADGASATVYLSRSEGRVAIVTRHLPAAPTGRVYQLWLQKDGRMVSAGLMHGAGDQARLLDGDLGDATAAGLTVEPAGGSNQPTTAPLALFDFEKAT
ncbi:MAG: anti-sigma factor [Nocardioidaceae bacterium]|nr:anti-sigma factor [Nocardioidaceae bacterium]